MNQASFTLYVCAAGLFLYLFPIFDIFKIPGLCCAAISLVYLFLFPEVGAGSENKVRIANDNESVMDKFKISKEATLKLIKGRRTVDVKDYTGEAVPRSEIDMILEAANWAPTHHKSEPWRYIVISGYNSILKYLEFIENYYKDHMDELSDSELNSFRVKFDGALANWPSKVSHMLVICMKRQALKDKLLPEWEEISATAISVQNIHLMTAALDLGGFWSSHTFCKKARDSEEMRSYLGLVEGDRVFGAFLIGKIKKGFMETIKSRRGPIEDKIKWRMDED